jgi:predicted nucleotidyltransferase
MRYKEAIKNIVAVLKGEYHPRKIILFGSCASGRIIPDSDIDMLIIKDNKKPYGQRWLEICRLVRHLKKPFPFEPFVLTPEELKGELKRNLFLQEIIEKGNHDLEDTATLLKSSGHTHTICFHTQQAVKDILKDILSIKNKSARYPSS